MRTEIQNEIERDFREMGEEEFGNQSDEERQEAERDARRWIEPPLPQLLKTD